MKVALLSKKTRGGTVVATMTVRFGDEKTLFDKATVADLAADMLMRGTTKHTRQQIKDELDRLKARVNVNGGPTSLSVGIETVGPNMPAVLRLVGEVLREPAFDPKEFDQLKQENIAGLEQARSEPTALASQAFSRYMSPYPKGDPRYTPTFDEQVADYTAATVAEARAFYAQFLGASHGELAVVGDFDRAQVEQAVGEAFEGWKTPSAYARVPREAKPVDPTVTSIETPDKANAFFVSGLNLPMRDDDPDYPAMLLANYMFGGSITGRAPNRIRNQEGLSYGVNSRFGAPTVGNSATFGGTAISNPQNTPKVEASFRDELAKTLANGFTADEVAAAKKALRDARVVGRTQDAALLNLIATREEFGRTLAWDEQMDAKLEALTVDQVNAAFRRHVTVDQLSIVKAGDFKAAGVFQ